MTGRWIRVPGEEQPQTRVYRRRGTPTPSRLAPEELELREDGSTLRRSPGPTDLPTGTEGTWELDQDALVLRGPHGEERWTVELGPDRMTLRSP